MSQSRQAGTYGVIASIATSRAREFAIRAALGADRARVTRLVLGQGVRLTVFGLGLGLPWHWRPRRCVEISRSAQRLNTSLHLASVWLGFPFRELAASTNLVRANGMSED